MRNGGEEWELFNPTTTDVVEEFAASIDTSEEVCSPTLAQQAADRYEALSDFEKSQFNDLVVGKGFTGEERLSYIKSFYDISDPISGSQKYDDNDRSTLATIALGLLSGGSIVFYYAIKRKRKVA